MIRFSTYAAKVEESGRHISFLMAHLMDCANVSPESVTWADVAELSRLARELQSIRDRLAPPLTDGEDSVVDNR